MRGLVIRRPDPTDPVMMWEVELLMRHPEDDSLLDPVKTACEV